MKNLSKIPDLVPGYLQTKLEKYLGNALKTKGMQLSMPPEITFDIEQLIDSFATREAESDRVHITYERIWNKESLERIGCSYGNIAIPTDFLVKNLNNQAEFHQSVSFTFFPRHRIDDLYKPSEHLGYLMALDMGEAPYDEKMFKESLRVVENANAIRNQNMGGLDLFFSGDNKFIYSFLEGGFGYTLALCNLLELSIDPEHLLDDNFKKSTIEKEIERAIRMQSKDLESLIKRLADFHF